MRCGRCVRGVVDGVMVVLILMLTGGVFRGGERG